MHGRGPLSPFLAVSAGRSRVMLEEVPVQMASIHEAGLSGDAIRRAICGKQQVRGERETSSKAILPKAQAHGLSKDAAKLSRAQTAR